MLDEGDSQSIRLRAIGNIGSDHGDNLNAFLADERYRIILSGHGTERDESEDQGDNSAQHGSHYADTV